MPKPHVITASLSTLTVSCPKSTKSSFSLKYPNLSINNKKAAFLQALESTLPQIIPSFAPKSSLVFIPPIEFFHFAFLDQVKDPSTALPFSNTFRIDSFPLSENYLALSAIKSSFLSELSDLLYKYFPKTPPTIHSPLPYIYNTVTKHPAPTIAFSSNSSILLFAQTPATLPCVRQLSNPQPSDIEKTLISFAHLQNLKELPHPATIPLSSIDFITPYTNNDLTPHSKQSHRLKTTYLNLFAAAAAVLALSLFSYNQSLKSDLQARKSHLSDLQASQSELTNLLSLSSQAQKQLENINAFAAESPNWPLIFNELQTHLAQMIPLVWIDSLKLDSGTLTLEGQFPVNEDAIKLNFNPAIISQVSSFETFALNQHLKGFTLSLKI